MEKHSAKSSPETLVSAFIHSGTRTHQYIDNAKFHVHTTSTENRNFRRRKIAAWSGKYSRTFALEK